MTTIADIGGPQGLNGPPQQAANTRRGPKTDKSAEATTTQSTEKDTTRAHGVLKLLQEGHFKGVADARLRINFAEEIAVLQDTATQSAAQAGAEQLIETAQAEVGAFLELNTLPEEDTQAILAAQESLESAVQAARDALSETSPPDIFQYVDDLQSAADTFIASVADILNITPVAPAAPAAEGETPTEAIAPTTDSVTVPPTTPATDTPETTPLATTPLATTNTTPSPFESFVNDLTTALNTVIDDLEQALQNVSALPPLSEPSGNGGAFEKFAALLNESTTPTGEAEPPDSLDIIA